MSGPARPSLRSEDLAAVVRPLEEATNLPAALHVSGRVASIEAEEIFARMWLCVGRHEDLPGTGRFFLREIGSAEIVVVRGEDGEVRAFHNVCRHRGSCLVREREGRTRAFRCGYHGWTYDTAGELIAAPLMGERPGFDPADWPLEPVRLQDWAGFLFVNLDPEGPDLGTTMADFPDLSRYGLEDLRRGHEVTYDVAANWKIVCENYSECYHCALVHPHLNRVTDYRSGGRSVAGECYNGGPMELSPGMTTLSMSGTSPLSPLPGLGKEDRRLVHYYNLYPNFLLGLAPDYAIVHRVWPRTPDRCVVVCEWLFPEPAPGSPEADVGEIIEFWDLTNRQDWELCQGVQRAASSPGARPGPYHPTEACVHAFGAWLVGRLRGRLEEIAG